MSKEKFVSCQNVVIWFDFLFGIYTNVKDKGILHGPTWECLILASE